MIDKIISMANQKVRLRFLAMERSLRATGCQLPLLVIPFDHNLFDLPKGSTWWEISEITNWLKAERAHSLLRKYQCLTVGNYQYVDADVCFLRNPTEVLESTSGFITSCGHWHNPTETCSEKSKHIMSQRSTTWQKNVFNSGQFACDRVLFTIAELKAVAMKSDFIEPCMRSPYDQAGLNLLIFESEVKVKNLTLPPICMESTWAGDYPANYECYWTDAQRKPYLIHWAGTPMDVPRPINQIFYDFLTQAEKAEWDEQVRQWSLSQRKNSRSVRSLARRFKHALQTLGQT